MTEGNGISKFNMSKIALEGIHSDLRRAIGQYNKGNQIGLFFTLKSIRAQIPKLKKSEGVFLDGIESLIENSKSRSRQYMVCGEYLKVIIKYIDRYGMYLPEEKGDGDLF